MSNSLISRLKTCMSMARGPFLQIHRSFAEELLVALETKDSPTEERHGLARCSECGSEMHVLETRGRRRRMQCTGCNRRVTTYSTDQAEDA
jgi:hypothetical protein